LGKLKLVILNYEIILAIGVSSNTFIMRKSDRKIVQDKAHLLKKIIKGTMSRI